MARAERLWPWPTRGRGGTSKRPIHLEDPATGRGPRSGDDGVLEELTLPDTAHEKVPTFPLPRSCPFDPPAILEGKRDTEPIFKVRIWNGNDAWVVTRHQDGRALLMDKRLSADSLMPDMPHQSEGVAKFRVARNFIGMDAPEHLYYRRKIAYDFGPKRMELLRPAVQSIVDTRLDALMETGPPAELVGEFALPVTSLVICELLGVPYEAHDKFEELSTTLLSTFTSTEAATKINDEMLSFIGDLFDEKLQAPTDDVMSRLAAEVHEGGLTRREAINTAYLLLVAGHETTAGQIGLGALVVMAHPEQQAALVANPTLAENAVEEILRYVGVSQAGRRRIALQDIDFHGVHIKKGDGVIVMGNSSNRDDEIFDSPNVFDIQRKNASDHVEFGAGTHICLGRPLARLELQVVFGTLFQRLPALEPAADLQDLPFKTHATVYGLESLPVTW